MKDKIWQWIAWHLPRRLVYWCGIRLWASATTGEHDCELVTYVRMDIALERWKKMIL